MNIVRMIAPRGLAICVLLLSFMLSQAHGQSCFSGDIEGNIRASSTLYPRELTGFFEYKDPGPLAVGDYPRKWHRQTWFGSGFVFLPHEYWQLQFGQLGSVFTPGAIYWNDDWVYRKQYSLSSFVQSSGPMYPMDKYLLLDWSLYSVISSILGHAPQCCTIEPTRITFKGSEVETGTTNNWSFDAYEQLSEEETPAMAIARAEKNVVKGDDPVAGDDNYSRNWVPPGVGETQTEPVKFWRQECKFQVDFGSCLDEGVYEIKLGYKEWPQDAHEPEAANKFEVVRFQFTGKKRTFPRDGIILETSGSFVPVASGYKVMPCNKGRYLMIAEASAKRVDVSCSGLPGAGGISRDRVSAEYSISLGNDNSGRSNGDLRLNLNSIDSSTTLSTAWNYAPGSSDSVTLYKSPSGNLTQIATDQCVFVMADTGIQSSSIAGYLLSGVSGLRADGTGYDFLGEPFVEYIIQNPDVDHPGSVQVDERRGGISRPMVVKRSSTPMGTGTFWVLSSPLRGRTESIEIVRGVGTDLTSELYRMEYIEGNPYTPVGIQKNFDYTGKCISQKVQYWYTYRKHTPKLLQEEVLNSEDERGGEFSFNRYDGVKKIVECDKHGGWSWFIYDPEGRVVKTAKRFRNSKSEDLPLANYGIPTFNLSDLDVEETEYLDEQDVDGDGLGDMVVRTSRVVLGSEVSRSYTASLSKKVDFVGVPCSVSMEVVCSKAGALWGDASNLVTSRFTYSEGPFAGLLRARLRPDGTGTIVTMSTAANGNRIEETSTGALSQDARSITQGTRVRAVIEQRRNQVVERTVYDISSNLLTETMAAIDFDSFGRILRSEYSDGTSESFQYDCCGLSRETGRDGISTDKTYDLFGRLKTVKRLGITTTYIYDSEGRLTQTMRKGTDGKEHATSTSVYSFNGSLLSSADAVNNLTCFDSRGGDEPGWMEIESYATGSRFSRFAANGRLLATGHDGIEEQLYESGVENGHLYEKIIKCSSSGLLDEWEMRCFDFAGRVASIDFSDGSSIRYNYNARGQLCATADQDGVVTIPIYNAMGAQEGTALDLNRNGIVDYEGGDRIQRTRSQIVQAHSKVVRRTTTEFWATDNLDAASTLATEDRSLDGLSVWSQVGGSSVEIQVVREAGTAFTETTSRNPGEKTVKSYRDGRLVSVAAYDGSNVLRSKVFDYDAFGRLMTETDSRNGATGYLYYDNDRIRTVTTPDPDPSRAGDGFDARVDRYFYDAIGNLVHFEQGSGEQLDYTYNARGQILDQTKSSRQRIRYRYDLQGRMVAMLTWADESNTGDETYATTTRWTYDTKRGWLTSKRYANAKGTDYAYYPSGRLKMVTNGRGNTKTLSYGNSGEVDGWVYSDTTPAVSMHRNRRGLVDSHTDAAGISTITYTQIGQLKDTVYSGTGILSGQTISRTFDWADRLETLGSTMSPLVSLTYDGVSRLDTVDASSYSAKYAYLPMSSQISSVAISNNGTVHLSQARAYDFMDRLTSITNTFAGGPSSSSYEYNGSDLRTTKKSETGEYWSFEYDEIKQLKSALKSSAGNQVIPGYSISYSFDAMGNPKSRTQNDHTEYFTPNNLNQIEKRTSSGYLEVLGEASMDSTTLIDGKSVTKTGTAYYYGKPLASVTSASKVPVLAVSQIPNAGAHGEIGVAKAEKSVFVPASPEIMSYDADGNLTQDGRWSYSWDADNRLIGMETRSDLRQLGAVLSAEGTKLEFAYDALGRRIKKVLFSWNASLSTWTQLLDTRYLYDGWNLMAEFDGSSKALKTAYVWGLDLSGTMQGAGGVGGLLCVLDAGVGRAPLYDGNGNVVGLVNLNSGQRDATYEYDPFGNCLRSFGSYADKMSFGFSTKFLDRETNFLYYGLRYYNPGVGRFINRDPIKERGGVNLYGFVGNTPVNAIDFIGLLNCCELREKYKRFFDDTRFSTMEEAFLSGALKSFLNGAVVYKNGQPYTPSWLEGLLGTKVNKNGQAIAFEPFNGEFTWGIGKRGDSYYATNAITNGRGTSVNPADNPEMVTALTLEELVAIGHSHPNTAGLSGYDRDHRSAIDRDLADTDYKALHSKEWERLNYTTEKGWYTYYTKYILDIDLEGNIEQGGRGSRSSSFVYLPGVDRATQASELKALFECIKNGSVK